MAGGKGNKVKRRWETKFNEKSDEELFNPPGYSSKNLSSSGNVRSIYFYYCCSLLYHRRLIETNINRINEIIVQIGNEHKQI